MSHFNSLQSNYFQRTWLFFCFCYFDSLQIMVLPIQALLWWKSRYFHIFDVIGCITTFVTQSYCIFFNDLHCTNKFSVDFHFEQFDWKSAWWWRKQKHEIQLWNRSKWTKIMKLSTRNSIQTTVFWNLWLRKENDCKNTYTLIPLSSWQNLIQNVYIS